MMHLPQFLLSLHRRTKLLVLTLLVAMPFMAAIGLPASYERALANTLVSEGYTYTNVSGDPGGPTKYGITIHDVRRFLNPNATAQDVRNLTLGEAKTIYRQHYWDAVGGDHLPAGLDYSVFDYAVNAGTKRALDTLHACIKTSGITKKLVPQSAPIPQPPPVVAPTPVPDPWYSRIWQWFIPKAQAATMPEEADPGVVQAIKCVNDRRMAFQMGLPSRFDKFKRGWRNRIKSVRNISLAMAGVKPATAALGIDLYAVPRIGIGKAYMEEPNVSR